MEPLYFEKEYRVHVYETGPDGKLSLYALFNYLQDIASDHAVLLGFGRDDLMRDNRIWVLSRMYAEISTWPLWEDKIVVRTWPNGTDKLFALRNYEVNFPEGGHIASGTSSWLILDQITRRVQRPETTLSRFNPNLHPEASPLRYATKLEQTAESGIESLPFKVKVSDIDLNLHTNNVQYLKWACDTYGIDFVIKNIPKSAEINYLAESVFDEDIVIKTSAEQGNNSFYNHSIYRIEDRKELCRIRIEWIEGNVNLR
jgi:medium-chain acyl-[acyl-carrier-protein] hydrolase